MIEKKKKIIIGLIGSCLILLALFLTVGVSGDPLMAGGAVCISFDKWDMQRADKVIIRIRGETYTITDTAFVKTLAKETLAGTYSEYCCSDENDGSWVEIYRGDRLLRRMRYISNHWALAYEADITHWVLFGKEGHAFLSKNTWDRLNEIISE